jgi:TFIIH basal transcription factor complex TTD-A subunit
MPERRRMEIPRLKDRSDSAVKQILLTLDERPGQSFIIEDLDEFHLLIRTDEEQRVKRELEAEVRSLFRGSVCLVPEMGMRTFFFCSWRRTRTAWKLRYLVPCRDSERGGGSDRHTTFSWNLVLLIHQMCPLNTGHVVEGK